MKRGRLTNNKPLEEPTGPPRTPTLNEISCCSPNTRDFAEPHRPASSLCIPYRRDHWPGTRRDLLQAARQAIFDGCFDQIGCEIKRATLRPCFLRARQSFAWVAPPVPISSSQRRPRAGCCRVKPSAESLPSAVKCSDDDFEACIAHLRPPVTHRRWCALAE